MESLITPCLSNHLFNEHPHLQVVNDTTINVTALPETYNGSTTVNVHTADCVPIHNLAGFLMCVLGIPGNVFVIVVYSWTMSTSTRVYLFALAIADLTVCIIGVVLTTVRFTPISREIATFFGHASVAFSTLLLAFVSLERLLAVRRPHTFSLSPRRAKWALVATAFVAASCAMVLTIAPLKDYSMLIDVLTVFTTMTSGVFVISCYSLMAVTLLMNARAAHRNVDVVSMTPNPGAGPSVIFGLTVTPPNNFTSRKIVPHSAVNPPTVRQARTYKGVSLLFIITVVYVACWTPQWLSDLGVPVPKHVRRVYVLNSVVNPFIYSAVSRMFRDDVRQFCGTVHSKLPRCCQ